MSKAPTGITMTMGDEVLRDLMKQAPKSAYKHLAKATREMWFAHRKAWLQQLPTKWGRGKKGIKFLRIGPYRGTGNKRTVSWFLPKERTAKDSADAIRLWAKWDAAISTSSEALGIHEHGGTTRSSKRMPVNIRTTLRAPEAWRKKYPTKRLAVTGKGSSRFLWEITGKRKKRARLRYVLTRKVVNKPVAGFYKTWDKLRPVRDFFMRKAIDLITVDLSKGTKGAR